MEEGHPLEQDGTTETQLLVDHMASSGCSLLANLSEELGRKSSILYEKVDYINLARLV